MTTRSRNLRVNAPGEYQRNEITHEIHVTYRQRPGQEFVSAFLLQY